MVNLEIRKHYKYGNDIVYIKYIGNNALVYSKDGSNFEYCIHPNDAKHDFKLFEPNFIEPISEFVFNHKTLEEMHNKLNSVIAKLNLIKTP